MFAAAATITGVAALARDSVDLAAGNGSVADVRGSALGVVTFGVGRFAQQAIRLSVASARGGRALQSSGLADDAVEAAKGSGAVRTAGGRLPIGGQAGTARASSESILRSSQLWGHMRPSAIARDTWADLRSGVDLARAPGLYRPSAAGHVSRPVDAVSNPLREYRAEVSTTWRDSKIAGVFAATGNEAAARGLTATPEAAVGRGWVVLSGGVQVVETVAGFAPLAEAISARQSPRREAGLE